MVLFVGEGESDVPEEGSDDAPIACLAIRKRKVRAEDFHGLARRPIVSNIMPIVYSGDVMQTIRVAILASPPPVPSTFPS